MSSYLVTGGAGFIGSSIARELLCAGHTVRVLDNLSSGKRENLDGRGIEFIEGDIRDGEACRAACRGIDYVIHQAAIVSVPGSVADPETTNEVNVGGTLRVFRAAKDAGARRVVYASSCAVYGNAGDGALAEDDATNPLSPYAASKLADEQYASAFSHCYGLATVGLRYFNVYGPRQDPNSEYAAVVPKFAERILRGLAPTIHGDGRQTRDFVFIADVVRANVAACTAPVEGAAVLNVASGRSTSILDIADLLIRLSGAKVKPVHGPERAGDIRMSRADITRLRETLSISPKTTLDDGLRLTLEWNRPIA